MLQRMKLITVIVVLLGATVVVGMLAARSGGVASRTHAEPSGTAVVINIDAVPEAKRPNLEELAADPRAAAQELRAAGFVVGLDKTERCLAVTTAAEISDDDVLTRDLADPLLAIAILERLTPEQLAAREYGYLPVTALSAVQQVAAKKLGQRHGFMDKDGRMRHPNTRLVICVGHGWKMYVLTPQRGQIMSRSFNQGGLVSPPTEPAIAQSPLTGSVLWWLWPHAETSWGEERVTVAAGEYTVRELLALLNRASSVTVTIQPGSTERHLAVAAENIAVEELLWAMEVATGLRARKVATSGHPRIILEWQTSSSAAYQAGGEMLAPIPEFGYYTATHSAIGREMLASTQGGPLDQTSTWIGWRLADLPPLYRNWIIELWVAHHRFSDDKPLPPLDPEQTTVLWIKTVSVFIEYQDVPRRGGGGSAATQFRFPAL